MLGHDDGVVNNRSNSSDPAEPGLDFVKRVLAAVWRVLAVVLLWVAAYWTFFPVTFVTAATGLAEVPGAGPLHGIWALTLVATLLLSLFYLYMFFAERQERPRALRRIGWTLFGLAVAVFGSAGTYLLIIVLVEPGGV